MKQALHPTIEKFQRDKRTPVSLSNRRQLDVTWLRNLCLSAGADDVGFVDAWHPDLGPDHEMLKRHAPWAKGLISFVCKMNREPIRTPARSVANLEFHHTGDRVNEIARHIVGMLEDEGIRALNPSMGFPMEMDEFPGKIWVISHKLVAVAAGLGEIGIHRNVIHPKFGNFILLGTIITNAEFSQYSKHLDFNPCLSCKLCVSACPVGAIKPDGEFNFAACYSHNYKEFMGGFTNWVEDIAESKNTGQYRKKHNDSETVSIWQSLSFGANYKAAYCMAVCPAGEDVISPFLADRPAYVKEIVKPLQDKPEPVYVVPGSDAWSHVMKRFPKKSIRPVKNGLRPVNLKSFLRGLKLLFQHEQARNLDAVYHFNFSGKDDKQVTISIRKGTLNVMEGLNDQPDLVVFADTDTWIQFIRKEIHIVRALLTRKIRIKGSPKLLLEFGKCFLA